MANSKHDMPQELYDALDAIVTKYNKMGEEGATIVSFKNQILKVCRHWNYCRLVRFRVKEIGCHPANRDGEGIVPDRAQSRIKVIKGGGFSESVIRANSGAMQDHPMNKHIERWTLKMCAKDPKYARYQENEIKIGTLGAGHAVHGFAQLFDEGPCAIDGISSNGRMSKE